MNSTFLEKSEIKNAQNFPAENRSLSFFHYDSWGEGKCSKLSCQPDSTPTTSTPTYLVQSGVLVVGVLSAARLTARPLAFIL